MKRLPDSTFFTKEPFGIGGTTQAQAETSFDLASGSATLGNPFRNGLGPDFSRMVTETEGQAPGDFRFLNRIRINQFALLTSVFGIDMMQNGLKNLQFNSDVSRLVQGYPKTSSIPYVKTESNVKQLAFMQSKSEGNTTAPSSLNQDTNWLQLTPTWRDINKSFTRIVFYPTFDYMREQLSTFVTKEYKEDVMSSVHGCAEYDANGKGMGKYGGLFGWAWDDEYQPSGSATKGCYRLFRIKQIFLNGNEIVELRHGSDIVFCRYFNGTDCNVLTSSGSGSLPLLCGKYKVEVRAPGGGGAAYYEF